jgi:hypothetical protein
MSLRSKVIVSFTLLCVSASLTACSDAPAPADATTDGTVDAATDVTVDAATDVTSDATTDVTADAATDVTDVTATDGTADAAADVTADAAADVTDAGAACVLSRALLTTSNYRMGGYALGAIDPPSLADVGAMAPDQDHGAVESGCVVYELLRGNDELAVLDTTRLPAIARRIPLRAAAGVDGGPGGYLVNPYDVLTLSPTRAWVVQYQRPRIAIVDPTRDGPSAVVGAIDLTPLRSPADLDPSGALEAARVVRAGRRVFVALQNLSAYTPVTAGTLAVIDPSTAVLVDADPLTAPLDPVVLTGRNPVDVATTAGGRVVVASAGMVAFAPPQMLDGVIEAIDATSLRPVAMRVTEAQLGGDLGGLVMLDESRGWAVVTRLAAGDGGAGDGRVIEFDLAAGTVGRTIYTAAALGSIVRDPLGRVWVLDRSAGSEGVRVFRPDGTALTAMALPSGMYPPTGLAFVP